MLSWIGALLIFFRKAGAVCVARYYCARFASAGTQVRIGHDFTCHGAAGITVGDRVSLAHGITLYALTVYPWSDPPQQFQSTIEIGNDVFINSFTELSSARRIVIGDGVMIAPRCFITDNAHGYRDPTRAIRNQPIEMPGEVRIGAGTQIGCGCFIQGNVTIGTHCLIGANSVVVHDIPDYCVAAGAPARVIRRYEPAADRWVRVTGTEGRDEDTHGG